MIPDRSICQLIDIPENSRVFVQWRYFPSRVGRLIEKLLKSSGVDSAKYKDGIPFSIFAHVFESDLDYTPGIGPINKHLVLSVLKETQMYEDKKLEVHENYRGTNTYKKETDAKDSLENYRWLPPQNLYEILDLAESRINEEFKFNDRILIVKNRSSIFTENPKTLDEIGQVFGITRERVRQIMSNVDAFTVRDIDEIPVLEHIAKLALSSNSEEDFQIWTESSEVTNYEKLSIQRLRAICKFFNFNELAESLSEKDWDFFELALEDRSIVNEIVALRQNGSIVNLELLVKKYARTLSEIQEIASSKYPRSTFFENWALAKTKSHDPEILKNLYLILERLPNATIDRILEGLQRADRKKTTSLVPKRVLRGLVLAVAGNPPSTSKLERTLLYTPDISRYDNWLLKLLQSSESGLMHSSEIYSAGISEGLPAGSISKYLNDCPFLYKPASAIYALLDREFSAQAISVHRQIVLDSQNKATIQHEFVGDKLRVIVTPNAANLAGGVLFPEVELKTMVKDFTFSMACSCGELRTKSQIKISSGAFWRSFAPFTRHLFDSENFKLGQTYSLLLDFDQSIATLEHLR